MNRDDIIRMAREAGAKAGVENEADMTFLECFAALVAAAERKRLLSASELCRVCEQRRIRHETATQDEANS